MGIARELKFPLDIELQDTLIPERDIPFVRKVLALILEERHIERSEQKNESRNLIKFKEGDIVMARVAVQSDSSKNKVAKLVYKSRGPYVVVRDTGLGSYECRKYGQPEGTLCKFLTEDLYLLPPQLLLCDEVDMADLRYLTKP